MTRPWFYPIPGLCSSCTCT